MARRRQKENGITWLLDLLVLALLILVCTHGPFDMPFVMIRHSAIQNENRHKISMGTKKYLIVHSEGLKSARKYFGNPSCSMLFTSNLSTSKRSKLAAKEVCRTKSPATDRPHMIPGTMELYSTAIAVGSNCEDMQYKAGTILA